MRRAALLCVLALVPADAHALDRTVKPGGSIQGALNEVARSGGGTVFVRAGTYRESLRLAHARNVSLVSVDGPGRAEVVSGETAIYFFGGSNNQIRGMGVRSESGNGIQVGGTTSKFAKGFVLDGNVIHDAGLDGIKVHQADDFLITNTVVHNSGSIPGNSNRDVGIDFVAVVNSELSDNTVLRSGGDTCVMVKGGSSGNLFESNDLSGCKDGFHVGGIGDAKFAAPGAGTRQAYNNLFTGNDISARACAFYLFNGEEQRKDNRIENNNVENGNGCGGLGTSEKPFGEADPDGYSGAVSSTDNTGILNELVEAFRRGTGAPGNAACNSAAMETTLAAGGAISSLFGGGRATVAAQFAQQLQLLHANQCAGAQNKRHEASNRNEVLMIDYYRAMLKGTDWRDERAAVAGVLDLAGVLSSNGRILSPDAVPADYEAAYPTVYTGDSESLGGRALGMAARQRKSQVDARRQKAAGVKSITSMPDRIARVMANARKAPGQAAVGQERVKARALMVEAVTAQHASMLAARQAQINQSAREQQDRMLEQQMLENAMRGWGECARCAR